MAILLRISDQARRPVDEEPLPLPAPVVTEDPAATEMVRMP